MKITIDAVNNLNMRLGLRIAEMMLDQGINQFFKSKNEVDCSRGLVKATAKRLKTGVSLTLKSNE